MSKNIYNEFNMDTQQEEVLFTNEDEDVNKCKVVAITFKHTPEVKNAIEVLRKNILA